MPDDCSILRDGRKKKQKVDEVFRVIYATNMDVFTRSHDQIVRLSLPDNNSDALQHMASS